MPCMVRGKYFIFIFGYLWQVLAKFTIEPVEIISSVYAIHTTGTSAVAVEPKGGYPGDDVGIPDEIRTA